MLFRSHTSKRLVAEGSEAAVIAALTPFCVTNYMGGYDKTRDFFRFFAAPGMMLWNSIFG